MTTRSLLVDKDKNLVGYRIKTANKGTFDIPVINVTRSEKDRQRGEKMIKDAQPGSKFFKPTYSVMGYRY